jgi:integrase
VLEAQHIDHETLKKAGHICPNVFWRMVAEERGGDKKPQRIVSSTKAWKIACRAAGCPGRIPHDLRRTAVRNLILAGVPQVVAMTLMGHKTDSVFRRYHIVSPADLRLAVERLDAASKYTFQKTFCGRPRLPVCLTTTLAATRNARR